jgi:hypothetical protein
VIGAEKRRDASLDRDRGATRRGPGLYGFDTRTGASTGLARRQLLAFLVRHAPLPTAPRPLAFQIQVRARM